MIRLMAVLLALAVLIAEEGVVGAGDDMVRKTSNWQLT